MNSPERVAIFRLDIALVLLLVLAGLGIWMGAERVVAAALVGWQPVERSYQLDADLPRLQADQARAEQRLAQSQAALAEAEADQELQRQTLAALRQAYPQLPATLAPVDQAAVPADVLLAYVDAQAGHAAAQQRAQLWERRLVDVLGATGVLSATAQALDAGLPDDAVQSQLRLARAELAAVEQKLVEQRVALAEHADLVESIASATPALRELPPLNDVPAPVGRLYADAYVRLRDGQTRIEQLTEGAASEAGAVKQRSAATLRAEQAVARRLAWDSGLFGFGQGLLTLTTATVIVVLLMRWVFGLLGRHQHVARYNARGVLWVVTVLLAVMFIYQAFQTASVALAGVALLAMLLWLIAASRHARAGRKPRSTTETV